MKTLLIIAACGLGSLVANATPDEPPHNHPAPERLGTVHFGASCAEAVQSRFDRAVALLHSFAYDTAAKEFREIGIRDTRCAMAHWGVAMSVFHQLWSPPGPAELQLGREQLLEAHRMDAAAARDRELIDAAAVYFSDTDPTHHPARAQEYERAMQSVAQHFPHDDEVQIFYALALIATAPPADRSHANQKRAAAILEPLYRRLPDHPGLAHYLIHAYDSEELAQQGLPAARAYAKIAPAAPHALHMPSHIFTRLGLWQDSIESNEAARRAAREQGDIGEELHAMDYLTYAYLQLGRDAQARQVVEYLRGMESLPAKNLTAAYAATAMPLRLAIERGRWGDVLTVDPLPDSAPQLVAMVHWARAVGQAHAGHLDVASVEVSRIDACEAQSRARGDTLWASEIGVLAKEARAWIANATGRSDEAVTLLRAAADAEESLEKPNVTPGPILPAREQLGQLLLDLHRPREALQELTQSLQGSPVRLVGLEAAIRAAVGAGDTAAAASFRRLLPRQAASSST